MDSVLYYKSGNKLWMLSSLSCLDSDYEDSPGSEDSGSEDEPKDAECPSNRFAYGSEEAV